jgi:hypothetical protein
MFLLDLRSHYTNQANLTGDHIHTPPKWGVTSSRGGLRPPPRNPRLARLAVTRGAHRSEARHPNPPPATPGSNRRNTPSAPARLTHRVPEFRTREPPLSRGGASYGLSSVTPRKCRQRRIERLARIPRPIIPRGNSRPFSATPRADLLLRAKHLFVAAKLCSFKK